MHYYIVSDSSIIYKLLSTGNFNGIKPYLFLTDNLQVVLDYQVQCPLSSIKSVIIVKSCINLEEVSQYNSSSTTSSESVTNQGNGQNIHVYPMEKTKVYRIQGDALLSAITPLFVVLFS